MWKFSKYFIHVLYIQQHELLFGHFIKYSHGSRYFYISSQLPTKVITGQRHLLGTSRTSNARVDKCRRQQFFLVFEKYTDINNHLVHYGPIKSVLAYWLGKEDTNATRWSYVHKITTARQLRTKMLFFWLGINPFFFLAKLFCNSPRSRPWLFSPENGDPWLTLGP